MTTSALTSSTVIIPKKYAGFPMRVTSLSRTLFPFTANTYQNRKGLLRCQASSQTLERTVLSPGTAQFSKLIPDTDAWDITDQSIKLQDSDASIFKDVITSDASISKDARASASLHSSHLTTSVKEKNPKRLCGGAHKVSTLDHHQVFRYPILTEHAMKEIIEHNTLVFIVDERADKNIIKEAARETFNIMAKRVNTLIMPDGSKKAYVTLVPECNALDVAKKMNIL